MSSRSLAVFALLLVLSSRVSGRSATETETKAVDSTFSDPAALEEYLRLEAKPLSELHAQADTDKDGLVSVEELVVFEINVHKNPLVAGLTHEEVLGGARELIQSCDLDADGKFNVEEFENCAPPTD